MSSLTLFQVRRQVQENLKPKGGEAKKPQAPVKTVQETQRETTKQLRENALQKKRPNKPK